MGSGRKTHLRAERLTERGCCSAGFADRPHSVVIARIAPSALSLRNVLPALAFKFARCWLFLPVPHLLLAPSPGQPAGWRISGRCTLFTHSPMSFKNREPLRRSPSKPLRRGLRDHAGATRFPPGAHCVFWIVAAAIATDLPDREISPAIGKLARKHHATKLTERISNGNYWG